MADKPRRYRPMTGQLKASKVNAISGMRVTTTDFRVCEYDFELSEYSSVTVSAQRNTATSEPPSFPTDDQPDLLFHIIAHARLDTSVSL